MPSTAESTQITSVDAISTQHNEESVSVDTNHASNGNTAITKLGINSGDTLKLTASVAYPTTATTEEGKHFILNLQGYK